MILSVTQMRKLRPRGSHHCPIPGLLSWGLHPGHLSGKHVLVTRFFPGVRGTFLLSLLHIFYGSSYQHFTGTTTSHAAPSLSICQKHRECQAGRHGCSGRHEGPTGLGWPLRAPELLLLGQPVPIPAHNITSLDNVLESNCRRGVVKTGRGLGLFSLLTVTRPWQNQGSSFPPFLLSRYGISKD